MIDLDQIYFFVKEATSPETERIKKSVQEHLARSRANLDKAKALRTSPSGVALQRLADEGFMRTKIPGKPQPGSMVAQMGEQLRARRAQQSGAYQAGANLRQAVGGAAARLRRLVRR